jgi:hypothetical protein
MQTDEYEYRFVYQHFRFLPTVEEAATMRNPWVPHSGTLFTAGRHGRAYHYQPGNGNGEPSPRGGYTVCDVYDSKGNCVSRGCAECSHKDSFCYKIGRDISRGRALKALKMVLEANG